MHLLWPESIATRSFAATLAPNFDRFMVVSKAQVFGHRRAEPDESLLRQAEVLAFSKEDSPGPLELARPKWKRLQ